MKGLAWPLGKKVVGVSTLAALAMNILFSSRLVCPVLDARKGEVYSALFDTSSGSPKAVIEDSVMTLDALLEEISKKTPLSEVIFLGKGLEVYSKEIEKKAPGALLAPGLSLVRASSVGLLGFDRIGEAVDSSTLSPVYLRRSEAEIKFG